MRIKSILSSSIGNSLEWYDFGLFEIFAPTLSKLFFPDSDSNTRLILTFGLFAAGYFCRPIGGLVFGYFGDKHGRAISLRMTIIMIALPTLLIGFLPTYHSIGLFAPLALMIIRMWQGFCIGGECGGNVVYLAELAPHHRRATITTLVSIGSNVGYLLALLMGTLCMSLFTENDFMRWGWRIPYFASGLLCIVIYIMRTHFEETDVFTQLKNNCRTLSNPVISVLKNNLLNVVSVTGIFTMGIVFFYATIVYMPTFLTEKLGYPALEANKVMIIMTVIMTIIAPIAGVACDRIGRRQLLLLVAGLIIVAALPCYYMLSMHVTHQTVFIVLLLFTIIASLEQGASYVAAAENSPALVRYTSLSLSYNIGAVIFGGTTPLMCEWLINHFHSNMAPAVYVLGCTMVTIIFVVFYMQDKHGECLSC